MFSGKLSGNDAVISPPGTDFVIKSVRDRFNFGRQDAFAEIKEEERKQ